MIYLNINELYPNQAFRDMNMDKIYKISNDIKKNGYNKEFPIFVTKKEIGKKEFYFIIDGHHRVCASFMNNLKQIPCIILNNYNYVVIKQDLYYDWEDLNNFKYEKYPKENK